MSRPRPPRLVPTAGLARHFRRHGISFRQEPALQLGFGEERPQYRLYEYPLPDRRCTMGVFFEWHTADFFDAPLNAHLAVGLRGPRADDPHRGRGLALGMLSLFAGCAPPPGGPAMFIEEFTVNEGRAAPPDWQLSQARRLPGLGGHGVYRVDLHVSETRVWAAIWQRHDDADGSRYRFMDQTGTHLHPPLACGGQPHPACAVHAEDHGAGNAFIGCGFARADNRARIEQLHIAHWPG